MLPKKQKSTKLTNPANTFKRATNFAEDNKLLKAFQAAVHDPKLWDVARKEPEKFLRARRVNIPEGFTVRFIGNPKRGKPIQECFKIRWYNCRMMWDPDQKKWVKMCFGIEIIPCIPKFKSPISYKVR